MKFHKLPQDNDTHILKHNAINFRKFFETPFETPLETCNNQTNKGIDSCGICSDAILNGTN